MQGAERLLAWFDSGALVQPSAGALNFVDLVRAVMILAGADGVKPAEGTAEIMRMIGPAEHYVLVLADGLGVDILKHAPEGGFLKTHLAATLNAVFPPTTTAALTTLGTTLWPAEHGLTGWYIYLDEFGVSAVTLPFTERFSKRPLESMGIPPGVLFTAPSMWPRVKFDTLSFVPRYIADSTYTGYSVGGTLRHGYASLGEACRLIRSRIGQSGPPTLTYFYFTEIDSLCHIKGPGHEAVPRLLAEVDELLGSLSSCCAGRDGARVVVTADHGLTRVPQERNFLLRHDEPIMEFLKCPPTCEPTVPVFHVKLGMEERFREEFARRWGEYFALITPAEADELHLFGPLPLADATRRRLGTFLALASPTSAITYEHAEREAIRHEGLHAGLSAAEMRIPLIIA